MAAETGLNLDSLDLFARALRSSPSRADNKKHQRGPGPGGEPCGLYHESIFEMMVCAFASAARVRATPLWWLESDTTTSVLCSMMLSNIFVLVDCLPPLVVTGRAVQSLGDHVSPITRTNMAAGLDPRRMQKGGPLALRITDTALGARIAQGGGDVRDERPPWVR